MGVLERRNTNPVSNKPECYSRITVKVGENRPFMKMQISGFPKECDYKMENVRTYDRILSVVVDRFKQEPECITEQHTFRLKGKKEPVTTSNVRPYVRGKNSTLDEMLKLTSK